jgi:hypothetical protein
VGIPKNANREKIPDYEHIKIPPKEWYIENIPKKYRKYCKDVVSPRERFIKRYGTRKRN